MITIRSLAGIDYDEMTAAFNDAFSDYDIPAHYTTEYLRDLVLRRGYRPDLAVGAFDGQRLVGFVFNCLDGDEAYNSGTGVVISHRRRGIARHLMERSIERLPAKRYILEGPGASNPGVLRRAAPAQDDTTLDTIRSWCDVAPTWQNEVASIRRANEPFIVIGDGRGGIVVFPSNGDVPLLAVAPEHRRKGLGRALLAAAHARAGKRLRIMNIDDAQRGITAFLERCGAQRMVRQIEMVIAPRAAAAPERAG